MRRRTKVALAVTAIMLAAGGGTGAALAVSGGDHEGRLIGADAAKAISAALAITGVGTANAVERDGEKGATYEIEVTKPDGATVDVRLDAAYNLVAVDADSEAHDAPDGPESSETP